MCGLISILVGLLFLVVGLIVLINGDWRQAALMLGVAVLFGAIGYAGIMFERKT
jgi:hypothetical protein